MSSRGPDWDYYQCKCGNVLYEYNIVTGEKFMSETWSQCISTCMLPAAEVPENTSPHPPIPIGPPKKNVTTETDEVPTASCSCSSSSVNNETSHSDSCTAKVTTQPTPPEQQPSDVILTKTTEGNGDVPEFASTEDTITASALEPTVDTTASHTPISSSETNAEVGTDKANGTQENEPQSEKDTLELESIATKDINDEPKMQDIDSAAEKLPESNGHVSPQESNGDIQAEQIVEDEPMSKDEPISEDKPLSKDEPSLEDKPFSKDENVSEDKPLSKDEPVSEDMPSSKDEPFSEDKPLSKDEPISEDKPLSKDETISEESPLTKEESVSIGEPTVAEETEPTEEKVEEKSTEDETPPKDPLVVETPEIKDDTEMETEEEKVETETEKMEIENVVTETSDEIAKSPVIPSKDEEDNLTQQPCEEKEPDEAPVPKKKSPSRTKRKTKKEAESKTEEVKAEPESSRVLRKRKTGSTSESKSPPKKAKTETEPKRVLRKRQTDSGSPSSSRSPVTRQQYPRRSQRLNVTKKRKTR